MKIGLVIVAVSVAAIVGYSAGDRHGRRNPDLRASYNNSYICSHLPAGLRIQEVVHALGSPIGAKGDALLFDSSPGGGPIQARVDPRTGMVALVCDPPRAK